MVIQSDLWKAYREETDCDVRERLLMVVWSSEGVSSYEVGRRLNCPHSKVLYWTARFEKEGLSGLKTRSRSGKPPKLPEDSEKRIREIITSGSGWQTKTVKEVIYRESGITYSQRHVVRLLHQWGLEQITPRKRHPMASEEEQREFEKKPRSYWIYSRENGQ